MTRECPRCKGREIYEIDQVCFEAPDSSNGTVGFALFAHYGFYGDVGWFGAKEKRIAVNVSAHVCGSCGFADLFTKDTETLKRLVNEGVAGIRRLA